MKLKKKLSKHHRNRKHALVIIENNAWFGLKYEDSFIILQAGIAQLVEHRLGTIEVVGSNPVKGEDFLKKSEFKY